MDAPVEGRRYDLVAFDMDGVLVNYTSCWTWVHDHFKVTNEASLKAFIEGDIDDMEFMRRDIALWRKQRPELCRKELESILGPLPINRGIAETVQGLKVCGTKCVIVSGGLDIVAEKVAGEFGFDDWIANGVECDVSGRLTGEGLLRVELRNKRTALEQMLEKYGVDRSRAACVGDSFVDITMFEACAFSIAFNPTDEMAIKKASVVVRADSLEAVLPHLVCAPKISP
ncbi:MAG: HAD family phosphatase [Methanomassiliicoccales archaeon]|jgi:phosphoserine phosphatase